MESVMYERGIRYELRGDYYLPCFSLPEDDCEEQQMELIVQQMAKVQGIDEELKAKDQMAWVGAMNNIWQAAREIMREAV